MNNLTFTSTASHEGTFSINRITSINNAGSDGKKYQDSGSYTALKRINAVGKGITNNKNYSDGGNKNLVNSHLGKLRGGGTVTPPKYNAKYNAK